MAEMLFVFVVVAKASDIWHLVAMGPSIAHDCVAQPVIPDPLIIR